MARGYLGHRYSDDLDFFVNDDSGFLEHARCFEEALRSSNANAAWQIDESGTIRSERFISLSMLRGEVVLKIDLVNDISYRVGTPSLHPVLGLLDTVENILSNKIGALYRYAEKDVARYLGHLEEVWRGVARDSQAGGTEGRRYRSVSAAEIISSFPSRRFDNILWGYRVDRDSF